MRQTLLLILFTGCLASIAVAQSTISDAPFELAYSSGPMGVMLPDYEFGSDVAGDPAFEDDLDNLGAKWELQAVRRFLGTRTSFEANFIFGWVEANANGSDQDLEIPNPGTGAIASFAGQPTHLESSLFHYGTDAILRDTWRTNWGGLSAGLGFSYLAFDQDFELERNGNSFIDEELNSDLVGIKGVLGWDGRWLGRRSTLDLGFGYYDLDMDYNYSSNQTGLTPDFSRTANEDAWTFDLDFSTRFCLKGYDAALKFGALYISDLPQVIHPVGDQAFINNDDGVLITAGLEIRL
jgi:hypothetical protein